MISRSQQTNPGRWLLPSLAALIAALAAILLGTAASASATVGAETRVGAISRAAEPLVEPPQHKTAGQHLGRAEESVETVVATGVAANAPARGWAVGQPIDNLTKAGSSPAWSTVRARYWKNRANSALDGEFSPAQLERMAAGKPPLHPTVGVPMELDHIIPRHLGGTHAPGNLREVWPWRHAELDPFRYYNGPTP